MERDFKTIKIDDLDVRPIRHYLATRVEAHLLIRMLAAYLTWHLRKALAPLTFTDENIPDPADPVAPAQRSPQAAIKDAVKQTSDGLPLYRYRDLIEHLATLRRQVINFSGQKSRKSPPRPRSRPARSTCSDQPSPSSSRSQKPHPSRPIPAGQPPKSTLRTRLKFGLAKNPPDLGGATGIRTPDLLHAMRWNCSFQFLVRPHFSV